MIVHDEGLPRGFWKLGKIEKVIAGRDGRIRGAVVRLPAQGRQQSLLHRPVQLLYPLEVHGSNKDLRDGVHTAMNGGSTSEAPQPQAQSAVSHTSGVPTQESRARPRRKAAEQAEDQMKACAMQVEDDLDSIG